jgi:hypothetical protein
MIGVSNAKIELTFFVCQHRFAVRLVVRTIPRVIDASRFVFGNDRRLRG